MQRRKLLRSATNWSADDWAYEPEVLVEQPLPLNGVPPAAMLIRPIKVDDLDVVASLHLSSYRGDHFTSRLPRRLLRKYYGEIVKLNPFSYIAVTEDDQPLGFVVGGLQTKDAIKNFVRKNFLALMAVSIKSPSFLIQRIANKFKPTTSGQEFSRVKLRLLSIAVGVRNQSRGTGHALLQHFERNLLSHSVAEYGLSVHSSNVNAIKFYEREKFQIEFETSEAKYYFKKLQPQNLARAKQNPTSRSST
jgi:ribosomal protein S18 acetylase RimI-like enzyme